MKSRLAAVAALCLLAAMSAAAQTQAPDSLRSDPDEVSPPIAPAVVNRNREGRTALRAVRIAQPLTLDGQLNEEWYRTVPSIDGWVQSEPREKEPVTEKTEAWVFFDDDTLYVALRNWNSDNKRIVANELRHDSNNLFQNDHIAVALDTFRDRRNGYTFVVTAIGGMREEQFFDERNANADWNTVWDARVGRFDGGWTVELAIPFKSLRYNPGSGVWGIQILRFVRWKNERQWMTLQPRQFGPAPWKVSLAASLNGLETPPLSKNLEIKPYAIGGLTTDRTARPAPINNRRDADAGVDLKYGLSSSLTADFTLNTDFAQVEEDEQQVNLTRFNLFFPEKREFFLEGQGIFGFGGRALTGVSDVPILFFSRQIGISQGKPVSILGGGRLTGRAGAYNVGVVNIQTDDEPAVGAVSTNFTAVRVRRDVLQRSGIGAIFTNRSASLRGPDAAQTFGVDGVFSLFQNVRFDTYLARTQTPGVKGNNLSYRTWLDYNTDRYGANLELLEVGANFNPEVGFLRRSDFRTTATNLRFSPRPAGRGWVRKYYYRTSYAYTTTGTGRLESRNLSGNYQIEMSNGDNINVDLDQNYELLEAPFRIAPGVTLPVGGYGFWQGGASYQLGPQRKVAGTLSISTGSFYSGDQTAASYRGRIALHPKFAVEPGFSYNWVDLPQGKFTTKLLSARVTVPLTPRMFGSVLLQYNSSNNSYSTNARLRWEYRPGSELFVVFSEGRNTLGPDFPRMETRGFVVKFNRLFRM